MAAQLDRSDRLADVQVPQLTPVVLRMLIKHLAVFAFLITDLFVVVCTLALVLHHTNKAQKLQKLPNQ
jgi:hypothetical protein